MAGRESKNTYSPNTRRPETKRAMSGRAVGGLIMTLLFPPLGLAFLWRNGVFLTRGRMMITALAALEMTLIVSMLLPEQKMTTVLPVASIPSSVTKAPQEDVADALSNLQELLSENYATPEPEELTEEEKAALEAQKAQEEAEFEEMMNTIVYSVYDGAVYYHAVKDCDGQINNKEQTVREALANRLAACSKCNPPHP